ncbi:histidine phosphatase family protein [Pseudomonas sp. ADAK18]|uniref:histidine phosphatase family protein n=1 Tax=Pseudomonas sp. ADAK18 TaxID=2730848 RepID=UPI001F16B779|nr:histidine phosphatase family protein [Pseudomonas sp. ADAK18]
MINGSLSKVLISIGFVSAAFIAYDTFAKNTVEDLGANNKLAQSGIFDDWESGSVILLIRHEERCDRSSNPCLGPEDGITLFGSQKAKETGALIRSHFLLDNSDIFTSPTTRTVQTSEFMLGKSILLPGRETICGSDIVKKLQKHKVVNKNLIVVTHNTCINDLVKASNYKKSDNPEYGSLLFAKISNANKMHIFGKLNPGDQPR